MAQLVSQGFKDVYRLQQILNYINDLADLLWSRAMPTMRCRASSIKSRVKHVAIVTADQTLRFSLGQCSGKRPVVTNSAYQGDVDKCPCPHHSQTMTASMKCRIDFIQ